MWFVLFYMRKTVIISDDFLDDVEPYDENDDEDYDPLATRMLDEEDENFDPFPVKQRGRPRKSEVDWDDEVGR